MAAMYYWSGTEWLPISTGGGSDSAHIVSETMPTDPAAVGDLWIQPNGTPYAPPGEGIPGPQGEPGTAATIEVVDTLTVDAGLPAEVVNVGNENKARFSFKIPQGIPGEVGPAGADGAPGEPGPAGADGANGSDGADGSPGPQGETGPEGIQGQPGIQGPAGLGIRYAGTVATQADLPASSTQGDLYVVSTPEPARGYVWDDTLTAWQDAGPVQGPQGVPGPQGTTGAKGDTGAAGPQGVKGDTGAAGPKGDTGATGPQGAPGADATLVPATSTVLGAVKIGTGVTVAADGTISVSSGGGMTQADADARYTNVSGDTMTGTLTVPSTVAAFQFGATPYNVFGGTGGVAVRSNTTNISTFTGASITNTVPIVTPATGNGVQFGAGGSALSRGSAGTKIASTGMIELPTTAPAVGEAVRRDYVDGRVIAQAAGSAAPSVAGLNAGTLWVEY